MTTDQIRPLFPVTQHAVYLNNASQAPLNTLVNERLQAFLQTELNPVGKKAFDRQAVRVLLARILGGTPGEFALTTSTGVGVGIIANGIPFKKGDNIVLPVSEHVNHSFPFLNLEKIGVEVRLAPLNADNSIDPEAIEALVDDNTRVVAIAAVRYNSGFRPNLAAISKIAHRRGALFVVDAAQGAGMVPIDVEADGIDVLCGCGFKWLLGFHGTGFLFVSKRIVDRINPILPGMYAAANVHDKLTYHEDSRKFETGTLAYALFDGWCAGLQLVLDIGVQHIYDKALENTDYVLEGLQEKGYQIQTPIKNRAERSAIVLFNTGSFDSTKTLYEKLTQHEVLVTLQNEHIRVSPNFFNTKEEISMFLGLL